jgi:thiol-disulfide isomerase/thioredoxin
MFEKPILIYSDYCVYCKNFLETLMKYPDLYNSFIRMNIDVDLYTKRRPQAFYKIQEVLNTKISKVPTLITPNAEHILSDVDAFKWLEYQIKLLSNTSDDILPFNPNEMISFSDNYSNLGSTDLYDAKEQSFKFFQDGQLRDDNYLNTTKTWDPKGNNTNGFLNDLEKSTPTINLSTKQTERQYFDNIRGKGSEQFKNNSGRTQNINFMDANLFSSNNNNNNNNKNSLKSKEVDMKLQQLMNDRDKIDTELNRRPRFN